MPELQYSIGADVILILVAILTKLASSVDDVIWLLPFVSPKGKNKKTRICMAITYIFVMCIVTSCAIVISMGGQTLLEFLVDEDGYWNAQRILSVASGILLFLYSLYLLYDWYKERIQTKQENDEKQIIHETDYDLNLLTIKTKKQQIYSNSEIDEINKNAQDIHNSDNDKKVTIFRLIIIAILGSLDDFSVQVVLLLGGAFIWYQLLIGIFIGSCIVVILCIGVDYIKIITKYIEEIPIWLIIGVLAVYTLIATFIEL